MSFIPIKLPALWTPQGVNDNECHLFQHTLGKRALERFEICFPFRFVYKCLNIHVYFLIVTIILSSVGELRCWIIIMMHRKNMVKC